MKKIIFTLTLFLIAMNLMAQEHLSFKGIPIEGSIIELKTYFNIYVADYTLFNGTRISSSIIKDEVWC